jgi:hypothetical protein
MRISIRRIQVIKMMRILADPDPATQHCLSDLSPGLVSPAIRKVVLYIVQEVVQLPPDLLTQALHFCRLTASLAHSLVQIHHLPIN